MVLFKNWKASSSTKRYAYVFCLGFMLGSALYLMGHNFIYSVQYDERHERYYRLYRSATTMGPLQTITRYSGTTGPWLTPAPTRIVPSTEFPVLESGIPKVIHQTWENTSIPAQFTDWVYSWEKNQGDWTYLFWTAPGAKYFIRKSFRSHKDMYKAYPTKLQKADARRYFIMYHYGGVFADLDMESLRPLDGILRKYPCIIAQEPSAHRAFLYEDDLPYVPMPGFMACRPKHRFFKLVLDLLQDYSKDFPTDALQSTGPKFLKDAMDIYLSTYNKTAEEYIYIAPSKWFLPTYDPMHEHGFKITCTELYEKLLPHKQQACDDLKAQNFKNEAEGFPYTNHHWAHTASSKFKAYGTVSVKQVITIADVV